MPPLLPIFTQKLIPWAQENLSQRLIVARPVMKKHCVPSDVELTPTKIPGKRVIVRNKRVYEGQRVYYAKWPEAGLHELDVPKLICILNGAGDFQAGKYIITCNQGHFIFFPPRTPLKFATHTYKNNVVSSYSLLQINLYRDSIHCIESHCRRGKRSSGDENCLIYHPQLVQIFKLIAEKLSHDKTVDFAMSGHLLSALFWGMSREIAAGRQLGNFPVLEKKSAPESVQEIRNYIKAHLRESLTIEKMAREMYMSPSQFTEYIKQKSGQTFLAMLTECRIAEAKFLLHKTKWSIPIIAEELGFKSPTYFGAFFGGTPAFHRECTAKNRKVLKFGGIHDALVDIIV